MNLGAVAIIIVLTLAVAVGLSLLLVRWYVEKSVNTLLTTIACVVALTITLFCVLLVPVDIYVISTGLDDTGRHIDLETVQSTQAAIQGLYYGTYTDCTDTSLLTASHPHFSECSDPKFAFPEYVS